MFVDRKSVIALVCTLSALVVVAFMASNSSVSSEMNVLEESSSDERATENSFYDSLAAKDAAKSHASAAFMARTGGRPSGTHFKNKNMRKGSFRQQYAQEKDQLEKAKVKMHHMEEKDRIEAEKQTFKMERMSAHEQAVKYEQHLKQLADSVLPHDQVQEDAVRDALVDDLHAPKPAISKLQSKAHSTIAHLQAARARALHAKAAPATQAKASPSSSIIDSMRRAGEDLEKRASDALFSNSKAAARSAKMSRHAALHPARHVAKPGVKAPKAHASAKPAHH